MSTRKLPAARGAKRILAEQRLPARRRDRRAGTAVRWGLAGFGGGLLGVVVLVGFFFAFRTSWNARPGAPALEAGASGAAAEAGRWAVRFGDAGLAVFFSEEGRLVLARVAPAEDLPAVREDDLVALIDLVGGVDLPISAPLTIPLAAHKKAELLPDDAPYHGDEALGYLRSGPGSTAGRIRAVAIALGASARSWGGPERLARALKRANAARGTPLPTSRVEELADILWRLGELSPTEVSVRWE